METLRELIDAAKKKTGLDSDTKIAKELGTYQQLMSKWMRGEGSPDTYAVWRLSDILDIEIPEILAIIECERAKTEDKKAFWEAAKKKIRDLSTLGAVGLVLAGSAYESKAYAAPTLREPASQQLLLCQVGDGGLMHSSCSPCTAS